VNSFHPTSFLPQAKQHHFYREIHLHPTKGEEGLVVVVALLPALARNGLVVEAGAAAAGKGQTQVWA